MHCEHRCKATWCTCVNMCDRQRCWLTTNRGLALSSERAPLASGYHHQAGLHTTSDWPTMSWRDTDVDFILSRAKIVIIGVSVFEKLETVCALLLAQRLERTTVSQVDWYPWQTRLYLGLCRWTAAHFTDARLCSKRDFSRDPNVLHPCGHGVHVMNIKRTE
jgi:hypothetical protein